MVRIKALLGAGNNIWTLEEEVNSFLRDHPSYRYIDLKLVYTSFGIRGVLVYSIPEDSENN